MIRILFIICLIIFVFFILKKNKIEAFSNYKECREKGFTKEFCIINPLPNQCRCENGSIGKILPGFKGECICNYEYL